MIILVNCTNKGIENIFSAMLQKQLLALYFPPLFITNCDSVWRQIMLKPRLLHFSHLLSWRSYLPTAVMMMDLMIRIDLLLMEIIKINMVKLGDLMSMAVLRPDTNFLALFNRWLTTQSCGIKKKNPHSYPPLMMNFAHMKW